VKEKQQNCRELTVNKSVHDVRKETILEDVREWIFGWTMRQTRRNDVTSDKGPIFEVERNEPWSYYTRSGRYLLYGLEAVLRSSHKLTCLRRESNFSSCDNRERHIAVSIATFYVLDGSEFDPRREQNFSSHPSRSALGPT